jgi:hypothetical protein
VVTVLFFVLAAVCFAVSATRRAGSVPWTDIGLVLVCVAFIFWIAAPGAGIDLD